MQSELNAFISIEDNFHESIDIPVQEEKAFSRIVSQIKEKFDVKVENIKRKQSYWTIKLIGFKSSQAKQYIFEAIAPV